LKSITIKKFDGTKLIKIWRDKKGVYWSEVLSELPDLVVKIRDENNQMVTIVHRLTLNEKHSK